MDNFDFINLGVLGAGNFGKAFLLPAFKKVSKLNFVGVCTASGVSSANVAKKYKMQFATNEPSEIIKNKNINAVMIATRHDSHAKYVLDSLKNDKAVYVEKPLCLTMNELALIEQEYNSKKSEGKNPYLMVGYNRRFSPLSMKLKKAFSGIKSPLSIIYRINAGQIPKNEWVQDKSIGGGRIIGEICHFIDFLTFLIDDLPISVNCESIMENDLSTPDVLTLNLLYGNGSIGTIHYFSNGNTSMSKEFIEVFGGGKCAQLINFKSLKLYGLKIAGRKKYFNQVKGFDEEINLFCKNLNENKPAPIKFEEIISTSKYSILAHQSLNNKTYKDF